MAADHENPTQTAPASWASPRPTQHELRRILGEHERWLASEGREGERAFAGPSDLSGFDLRGANLARAIFTGVNLRGSNLEGARLTAARGLTAEQLAGTNLADAELPESLGRFEALTIVEELSKSSRATLLALLGACAYCWLTIGTTMDVRLLANTGTSPLPIVQTNVPIASFYWIVPVALLFAYLYLHLHLQKLWQALGTLPAVFPNSMRLHERVYPWLLSNIACSRMTSIHASTRRFVWLDIALAEVLTWWIIPLTTAAFWLRYLSRHDWRGTALHIIVVVAAVAAALVFRTAAYAALAGQDTEAAARQKIGRVVAAALAVTIVATSFSALALGTTHFEVYGATFFPDLRGAHLSGENLRGTDMRHVDATGVILDGADVRDAQLDGVRLSQSNLRAADLRNSSLKASTLTGADMRDTHLQEANLSASNLQGALLNDKTDLQGAHLEGADLRKIRVTGGVADNQGRVRPIVPLAGVYMNSATLLDPQGLRGAMLTNAVLNGMTFDKLDIRRANLRGALLDSARFNEVRGGKQTYFHTANLRRATFVKGIFKRSLFDEAKLQDAQFIGSALPGVSFRTADMQRVVFRGATLPKAVFDGARLDGASFLEATDVSGASFANARLVGADLTGAVNLTQSQLDEACGNAATKLPERQKPLKLPPCAAP